MRRILLPLGLLAGLFIFSFGVQGNNSFGLDDPFSPAYVLASTDTIPDVEERYEDFVTDPNTNPFDLEDPGSIERNVEYDPETGQYIITEKIGDFNFRPPTYMTFDEYMEYRQKQEERDYFNRLAGITKDEDGNELDPIAEFDLGAQALERLFGGTTVDIRPQGSIDLTFGVDFQRLENPILTERQRRQGGFDFDMDIQMNVTGKIGEKLNLTTNYNTNATFDFDNQIKLDYNSDLFSEDDIIKSIEAGNVSLPLRGTLIQGAQSLFGLKTELQFGHLRLTAIASQQKSQRENIQVQGGAQVQEFEVRADDYDENRHFFVSHYNRDVFEPSLRNLPQVNNLFRILSMEVWITNDRNEVENVRDIVAFADLGEPRQLVNPEAISTTPSPRYREICQGQPLPANEANDLYERLQANDRLKEIDQTVSILQNEFGLQQSRDFEKVSARKLRPTEYTYHPDLGFISVNVNVQPDQVLAVTFSYSYNGSDPIFVGDPALNSPNVGADTLNPTPRVIFTKMLKSTTQRTDVPTWDLMMKNVYSIGAFQVNQEDFRLDIFYDDPGEGLKRFLPEGPIQGRPLLQVFNLDNLNVLGDPAPDGVFDFVPDVTINTRNGRIMFPVLEPFGEDLAEAIGDPDLEDKYVYRDLYRKTKFLAREAAEQNRFVIKGSYKSSVSSEISLGAFNIPPGSVNVSAGGQTLREGRDYEVDYSTGRVKILNDAILSSGVPINVSFEDNTLFGFQTKTMVGLRADYELDENFAIGATYLSLFERPFTQKVNIGDDPIANKIYGLDVNLSREAPWLTKAVDAIPLLSTTQPSNINFSAEAAVLKPGHARAINQTRKDKGGVVYVDDFEGSASSFDLRQPVNQWFLASVPQNDAENNNPLFPESKINNLESGANRAKLAWYRIDPSARGAGDDQNPYTSLVPQEEVFPNVQLTPDQLPNIQTLDLAYYPTDRGPYNFDPPEGYPGISSGVFLEDGQVKLKDPKTRWGGIMRALNTNDFQSANIEFLEFWMLSPFHDPTNGANASPSRDGQQGDLYINLGNISEDILKDSRKAFENGLPGPANPSRRVDTTVWSVVPIAQQITRAFDNDPAAREQQDVGLDGFDNEGEREHFRDYLTKLEGVNSNIAQVIANDLANDDFRYYRDESFPAGAGISERYRDFNNPQGNSQSNQNNLQRQSGTNIPDAEDLNRDNTLNETESYFQYRIPLKYDPSNPREIDLDNTPYITDRQVSPGGDRIWYRFRIPLNGPDKVSVGGIQDFRSIRFIRMYMHGFETQTNLRFARLELVRNQWRRYTRNVDKNVGEIPCGDETSFDVDAVNIEENSSRMPFPYVLPENIQREQSLGVFNALQNEQSLSMKVQNLCDGDSKAIFKYTETDMRVYKGLKMFVHAESRNADEIPDGALSIFLRLGSDFQNNYYEYEIPLVMSDSTNIPPGVNPNDVQIKREVWRIENEFDVSLIGLRELKERRNQSGFALTEEYVESLMQDVDIDYDGEPEMLERTIKVRGNPNLGNVKVAMVGVRNVEGEFGATYSTEVWVNEMRLTGLDERAGVAAIARMDMQLADFGNITIAGNYSSIGFGALDQSVHERSREEIAGFDVAANFELGKFFPENWGLSLPFYGQISSTVSTPEYDPYDEDLVLRDKAKQAETSSERDSILEQAQDAVRITSFNFTNVRKEPTRSGGNPKPWDISNFSVSYSNTTTDRRDPIVESSKQKKQTAALDYTFSRRANYFEPFKGIKSKYLRLISNFNLNPLPNSFSFSTVMDREFTTTSYRFTGLDDRFNTFYVKRFNWNRDYDLQWDFTKSLKFTFSAANIGVVDEPQEIDLIEDPTVTNVKKARRDSIWTNIGKLGRTKNYSHNINLSYNLPLRYLPFMDWVQVRANYQADYSWTAAALNVDSLGNFIQNSQNRQVNVDLSFDKLYDEVGFLKDINRGRRPQRGRQQGRSNRRSTDKEDQEDDNGKKARNEGPSDLARALIRPLLLVRKLRFNYSERFRTSIPGYTPQSRLLGMSSGFDDPGWGFIAGLQPKIRTLEESQYNTSEDWLYENRDFITRNVWQNQPVAQDYTQDYDARLTLEPFRDFRLELEINKSFTEDHTQFYKDTSKIDPVVIPPGQEARYGFVHSSPINMGSMTISYSALNTLFMDSEREILDLFDTFEDNRLTISERLGSNQLHQDSILSQEGYKYGYGSKQQNVILPAFIAAYTEEDPNSVGLDVFKTAPRPNWRLTYNGLSKIPLFADLFENFSLSHGYQSTLSINSFQTGFKYRSSLDPAFNDPVGYNNEVGDFYPRLEIPEVVIQESFSPLIAVDATLTNGMSFNVDYKKSRTLALSFVNSQLSETQTKEILLGFGYLMREVDIPFLTGSKKKKRGRDDEKNQQDQKNQGRRGGSGRDLSAQDLDIQFSFSLRDDVTFAHRLDEGVFEPTRGNYALSISPSAEYKLNRRLSLRLFFDYRRNVPKTSAGFPRTDTSGGLVVRFSLN